MYRLADKYGGRPYTYIAPNLQLEESKLSIDYAIDRIGFETEEAIRKDVDRQARQREARESASQQNMAQMFNANGITYSQIPT